MFKKILCTFLIIVILFCTSLSASASEENIYSNLKNPFLSEKDFPIINNNFSTKNFISSNEYTFEEIDNGHSETTLKTFGITLSSDYSSKTFYDKFLQSNVVEFYLDNYNIQLNSKGEIVNIQNNKYFKNLNFKPKKSKALDVNDLITKITKELNLFNYTLSINNQELSYMWTLVWYKNINGNLINPYDNIILTVDCDTGELISFAKNELIPNTITPITTKEQALKIANQISTKTGTKIITNCSLTIQRPNLYWEGLTYKYVNCIRLCWEVVFENGTYVHIDAETGEILGGGINKSSYKRVLAPLIADLDYSEESAHLADSHLINFGYINRIKNGIEEGVVTHAITKRDVLYVLNDSNLSALYITSHGSENTLTNNTTWRVYANEVESSSKWKFVFLDACKTSKTTTWCNAFGLNKTGGAFVGWYVSVNEFTSYFFCTKFWPKLASSNSTTILEAVNFAMTNVLQAGYSDCQPSFIGDPNYNGRA